MPGQEHIFHPDFVVAPYWWDKHPPADHNDRMPRTVDIAIVGSGYCGLAAGLALARQGWRVATFDAHRIGEGASTRNGGMVSGGLKLPAGLRRKVGQARYEKIQHDSVESFRYFESFLAEEGFDVDYQRTGRFAGAHSAGAYARQVKQAKVLNGDMGLTARMVPSDRQDEEIGSRFYHGGMVVEECGGIDPAKYHHALRHAYGAAGGSLHSRNPVREIIRDKGKFLVQTARGAVAANHVFVATNGYGDGLVPYFQRRVIPITTFVIATEPLPADLIKDINPKGRMLVDTKRILNWYRITPCGRRIIFGGRAKFSDVDERESAKSLYQLMCKIWPQVRDYRISHAWKGNVAFTFDHLPHIDTHQGIHYAGGCQGAGIAMATYLGHRTAMRLLHPDHPSCGFENLGFPSRPLYYGKPWFIPPLASYYKLLDRVERWTGW